MRTLGLVVVAGCFASPTAPGAQSADAIIDATIAMYANAKSYVDRGTITTAFISADGSERIDDDHRAFETAFVRGGRFRFEVVTQGSPYTVWNDGAHTYSRWRHNSEPGVHMEADLITALRQAGSASDGVSTAIPRVLLNGEVAAAWLSALRLKVDGTDAIDGSTCWRLVGTTTHGEAVALWIDQKTHALRRTVDHHRTKTADATATVDITPIIDHPVDPAKLATPLPDGPELPWIGVVFAPASRVIAQVIEDTPGARAKLVAGDEITAIDGDPLPNFASVQRRIGQSKIGARLLLSVQHGADTRQVVVIAENRPYLEQLARERLLDKPAPDFTLPVVAGTYPATRAELAGKVIVLAFGSIRCSSCMLALHKLDTWQSTYAQRGLRTFFVSADSHDDIDKFAREGHLGMTIAQDPDDKLVIAFMRTELPIIVVIDRHGIVRRMDAYAETDDIETTLRELLK